MVHKFGRSASAPRLSATANGERSVNLPPHPINQNAVLLNIPYDREFEPFYLAYIVGLSFLGLEPYITSGIPGGRRRLIRVRELIQSCRYSIHDLSRVELSPYGLGTPRFNMPLELGMTIMWAELNETSHTWFVLESEPRRLDQSTSDLGGTDANIHNGPVQGVLSELRSAFVHREAPIVSSMLNAYRVLKSEVAEILTNAGTRNLYAASVFKQLCFEAWKLAKLALGEKG